MRAPHMRKSLLWVGFYLFFPTILECVFILFYFIILLESVCEAKTWLRFLSMSTTNKSKHKHKAAA